ncbi:FadR/GntR family transcriptional regulator [Bradyrhizobium erythrophlei]|uniref:FadR/GntR family transcriptional regulator n=1 Tax=Bradyrhizobium erythrophlei TaxID=1437360 RepID=UPI0035F08578
MAFQAVSRGQRLSDKVAEQLASAIETGQLTPGARLPRERELTEKFQVSRMVIREALSRLKSEGLIRSQQGLGAFVTEISDRDVFRLRGDLEGQNDRRQIFELRIIVECSCANLAAQRATRRDLARIEAALNDIRTSIEVGDEGAAEDFRFHVAIAAAAKNSYLESFVSFIGHRLYHSIAAARANTRVRYPNLVASFQRDHEVIFGCIRDKDGARAERAMRAHLQNTMDTLL